MNPQKIPNPRIEQYIWANAKDEFRALLVFVRYQWYVVLLAVAALGILFHSLKVWPPSTVRVATGQPNSTLEILGKKYRDRFKAAGIELVLVPSAGAAESLALLRSGQVDAALSQAGLEIPEDAGVVSLGSVGYQPLWLFHTGAEVLGGDVLEFLRGKRVYVGVVGSGTRTMVDTLLKEAGLSAASHFKAEGSMSAHDGAAALLSGQLDAVFLTAGHESGNARMMYSDPRVRMADFNIADALARRIGYFEKVTLPRGSITLSPPRPATEVRMVATTTIVLARRDLHHAIENLFLSSSKGIYESELQFFDRPGGFPAFTDKATPRSDIAERYYTQGPPLLSRHLPFWLASFLDLVWFSLLTAVAVIFPIFRMTPGYRKYMFGAVASRLYAEMFELEQLVYRAAGADELAAVRGRIEELCAKVRGMWVPKGCKEDYSFVVAASEVLVGRANTQLSRFGVQPITGR